MHHISQRCPDWIVARTQHALNLGAATRDDKVASEADLALFIRNARGHIIVEEKVDGANMGISIRRSDGKIVVQNRSHFVSSSYHAQFQPLDKWLAKHTADLWEILEPGRHILYGEWLYATHSVRYDRLPGWFIAYDIYDKAEDKFLARACVTELLAKTEVSQISAIDPAMCPRLIFLPDPSSPSLARRQAWVH